MRERTESLATEIQDDWLNSFRIWDYNMNQTGSCVREDISNIQVVKQLWLTLKIYVIYNTKHGNMSLEQHKKTRMILLVIILIQMLFKSILIIQTLYFLSFFLSCVDVFGMCLK